MIFETDLIGLANPKANGVGGSGMNPPIEVLNKIHSFMVNKWNGGSLRKFVKLLNDEFSKYNLDYDDFVVSDLKIRADKSDLYFDIEFATYNDNDDFVTLEFWFNTWDGENYIKSNDLDNY